MGFSLFVTSSFDDYLTRFIYLPECKHIIEVDSMDGWMEQEPSEIGHRTCPRCTTPILYSRRYKKQVDAAFDDVAQVRRKVFGERGNNAEMDRLIGLLMGE
jgi:hypothetical protein